MKEEDCLRNTYIYVKKPENWAWQIKFFSCEVVKHFFLGLTEQIVDIKVYYENLGKYL